MATSLAAIGITALAGVIGYSITGRVEPVDALLVGVPGAIGATRRRGAPAADPAARRSRCSSRCLLVAIAVTAARVTTVLLAIVLGLAAGVLAGLFGVGGGILFVPDARPARPRSARGGGDVAARDPADRRRRESGARAAYGNVRWRAGRGGRARRRCPASRSGSGWPSRCPRTRCGGCSRCCSLAVAAQIAWRARRPASYP